MKRAAAIMGVVAMVMAALFVRGTFSDERSDGDRGTSRTASGSIICPTEFVAVCGEFADGTTRAGATADDLIDAESPDVVGGGWIVPAAWARLVIDERARLGRAPLFEIGDDPIATSTTVMVVWESRSSQLGSACGDVDWRCISSQDGVALADGDRVKAGSPDVESATGLPLAAAQAANILGRPDYAANDFSGEFNSLAARLAKGGQDDPVGTMRTRGPGRITAAAVVAADADSLSTNFDALSVLDVAPTVRVDVVALVARDTAIDAGLRGRLTDSFIDAGWSGGGGGGDGLPSGSVLAAIRTLWNESR